MLLSSDTINRLAKICSEDEDAWKKLITHQYVPVRTYPKSKSRYKRKIDDVTQREWDDESLNAWFFWGYAKELFRRRFGKYRGDNQASFDPTFRNIVLGNLLLDYVDHLSRKLKKDPLFLRKLVPSQAGSIEPISETRFESWIAKKALASAENADTETEIIHHESQQKLKDKQLKALAKLKLVERCLFYLDHGASPPQDDIAALAVLNGCSQDEIESQIEALLAQNASRKEYVDILTPPKNDSEQTPASIKTRRNRLDKRYSRAKPKLQAFLEEID